MTLQTEVRDIVSRYLKRVSPSGPDDIMAICPFHVKTDGSEEQHPSFAMSLSKGVYYCHSCHSRGNLYTFLKDVGVDGRSIQLRYKPLLDALSRNQKPATASPILPRLVKEQPLPESVLGLFQYCPLPLVDPDYAEPGDPVYDESFIQSMGIGYDIKHNRITFPLRDFEGALIGISGRSTTGEWPRYKVYTTEYEAYSLPKRASPAKGSIIWNYHETFQNVHYGHHHTPCVVVEGFKACLSVLSTGFSSVALLGSHMTDIQQKLLEQLGCTLYLMLDNDDAGLNGLAKMAPKLVKSCRIKVVNYEGRQPSDLATEDIENALDKAINYYEWSTQNGFRKRSKCVA